MDLQGKSDNQGEAFIACPFCEIPSERIIEETSATFMVFDGFPVSKGHTLIIPRRHVGSFFELDKKEQEDILSMLDKAKTRLDADYAPDGYNIGINDGPAAGQTVPHMHIHLIPRYVGDQDDPRGGIRLIFPEKADYWTVK